MTNKTSPDINDGQNMVCKGIKSARQDIGTSNIVDEIERMYDVQLAARFLQDALEQKDFLMHPKSHKSFGSDFVSSVRKEIHPLLCTEEG